MTTNSILALTPETYEVPPGEELHYHARIEVRKFNADNGARISRPMVQKFGPKGFKNIRYNLEKQGYQVDVLHDPTKHLAAVAEHRTAVRRRIPKARVETEVPQSVIDKIRAEALAEFKRQAEAEAKAAKVPETEPKKAVPITPKNK